MQELTFARTQLMMIHILSRSSLFQVAVCCVLRCAKAFETDNKKNYNFLADNHNRTHSKRKSLNHEMNAVKTKGDLWLRIR